MKITPDLFEAFSKCPTKCWLQAAGELSFGNAYAEWVKSQNASYRATATERLLSEIPKEESALSPPPENLNASKWCLAASLVVQTQRHSCDSAGLACGDGRLGIASIIPIANLATVALASPKNSGRAHITVGMWWLFLSLRSLSCANLKEQPPKK